MTTPNILDPVTQAAWDAWCDARIDSQLETFTETIVEEVGTMSGQHAKKIFEILEILGLLVKGKGNEFIAGRLHQIKREFEHQNEIMREVETVETTVIEQQQSSRVSQVMRTIDQILAH